MASLQLTLFGVPRIEREGIPATPDRRKALALLALLALAPTSQSRDYLAEMLWPERDPSSARTDLRSTLFVLRQAIGSEWLEAEGDCLALRRVSGLNVDVLDFRGLIAQAADHVHAPDEPCAVCIAALAEAVELCRGDFLQGFTVRDAPEFDDWQTYQTESLRLELAGALERLVGLEAARGDYEAAVRRARSWLELDPLCEEPHRALMRLYAEAGNRAAALRQYEECARILDEELGIRPDAETDMLRDAVANGDIEAHPAPAPRPPLLELPPDRTPFIGREVELTQIAARLDDPACRLLTVLGPGGSGKTRLAVQAARDRDGRYNDGIYFVDLAPVESSELLVPTILRALSIPEVTSTTLTEHLIAYLRGREVLMVLDNFEHLLDSVELLPRLLGAAPGLTLLVTSRVRLNLMEEWLLPLEGMDLPSGKVASAELQDHGATALFLACVRRLQPGYRPGPKEANDIVRVCRLLDGMPLGIELGAARARSLSVGEIAAELARGLDVLATTMRNVPERHRSMAATFDASWPLLTPPERRILRELSVFRGGFTREAAQVVTGASADDLTALVDSCWLRVEADGRWGMHELIRQYCEERLEAEHETTADHVRARHCHYYTRLIEQHYAALDLHPQATAETLPELGNFQRAWRWAVTCGDSDTIYHLSCGITFICNLRGWYRLAGQLYDIGIDLLERRMTDSRGERDSDQELAHLIAYVSYPRGNAHFHLGQLHEANACATHALALLRQADPSPRRTESHIMIVYNRVRLLTWQGYWSQSLRLCHVLLRTLAKTTAPLYPYLPEVGSLFWQAFVCQDLGVAVLYLGRYEEACDWFRAAITFRDHYGDQRYRAHSVTYLARVFLITGNYEKARECAQAALHTSRVFGDRFGAAGAYSALGRLETLAVRPSEAHYYFEQALIIAENTGNHWIRSAALNGLGEAALASGELEEAERRYRENRALFDHLRIAGAPGYAEVLLGLGRVALARDEAPQARTYLLEALAAAACTAWEKMDAIAGMAEVFAMQGELDRAAELLALVADHPFTAHETRQRAVRQLAEVECALPHEVYAATVTRGESCDLETMIAELLAEEAGGERFDHALS